MNAPPLSVKAVVLHQGRVLLLVNERDEWDLPGGRPEAGEDHRTALAREVREETGLGIEIGTLIDDHLFEVLPQRFVRILAFRCTLTGNADVVLSDEHLEMSWVSVADIGETIAGRRLPAGYLGAIRQLIDQPPSPSVREV
ncbi:MAG: NUDIX hydrolase [Rhodospirillaceae bacterium]|nr:NUDIX hydrolase [Rhodospirillaceae bacterium]